MAKSLYKILLVTVSISFFISAIELDLGECHNTFFDEYDTYVKAEQVSINYSSTSQQAHDYYTLINFLITHYTALSRQPSSCNYQYIAYYSHYPPKLFLRNSVWRL